MTTTVTTAVKEFINHADIPESFQIQFINSLDSDTITQLNSYFDSPKTTKQIPLCIYQEQQERFIPILVDPSFQPPEPGEEGSLLAYLRMHGFNEDFIFSDCFGQLSCSSCAIELLKGTPENETPRDEEYDMLDIDEDRPPTSNTRLGCQVRIGKEALLIKIRKIGN